MMVSVCVMISGRAIVATYLRKQPVVLNLMALHALGMENAIEIMFVNASLVLSVNTAMRQIRQITQNAR